MQHEAVSPDVFANLLAAGNTLMRQGRWPQAAAMYERALALDATSAFAHNNLAVALAEQGQWDRALAEYNVALRCDPTYVQAHYNLGNALQALSRHAQALHCYERALELHPGWPPALNNRGVVLAALGQQALAQASYQQALRGQPDSAQTHNNLGLCLQLQGQCREAMACFDRALEIDPSCASAHTNRAQLRLLNADLQGGWAEYEWRWQLPHVKLPLISLVRWNGELVSGLRVLLRAEQGMGDTIQFVRFAALLERAGLHVIVECHSALASLLGRATGVHQTCVRGHVLPHCDAYIPVASLPLALGMFDDKLFCADMPYLSADPTLVAQWREKFAALAGLKVGIAWKGNPGYPQDRHRSIPLQRFAVLAEVPGVTLVNVQYREKVLHGLKVVDWGGLEGGEQSFEHTAAVIANLDLVITCDTVTGHLAGALGKPVWIAVPVIPDWRWMLGRDESSWYPSVRLFRQKRLDDWAEVFESIKTALALQADRAVATAAGLR